MAQLDTTRTFFDAKIRAYSHIALQVVIKVRLLLSNTSASASRSKHLCKCGERHYGNHVLRSQEARAFEFLSLTDLAPG